MLIIPAIDIKNGRCVRLTQGKFDDITIYSDDPVQIAKGFERDGANLIHMIDLDGAKTGKPVNLDTIKNIVKSVSIPIQVGGGIRTSETVKILLDTGVSRIILGTIALEDEEELKKILKKFALQVIIALDTKNGKLMKQGWLKNSDKNIVITAKKLEKFGVKRFIYTDVTKDGTLTEPNHKEINNLIDNISVPIIAGGGISNIRSLKYLNLIGIEGVIIGKALYEKKINLSKCIKIFDL
ncbi:1-(5-phosphoribosyl)-5-[(5-phosphoribosylamino)methylideneamino]imidazole-4-carboxamide isomerase [Patescibacteria group bacterium]|nr:1-(5-phosphoribosyl)-5-[(5-phosphoribosylamino)methylideneamino]imidazole-4-carboxamide isomerase [Patescibacteria group bacterium]MBU4017326.1 1-(5-phosphoribosyl)-5-[(5-phosphoribosylamino)methylideneamino]imidazole-4-carboxamide isomerase [Patescibacteria group bacterium]MBU4099597.1 1-(5-phosphoribosyl)-5-[(5-phosphoribosylamino)methylideneamino]imidazole-4-carboxamide isomerase [Patescibacteria group bacterium]